MSKFHYGMAIVTPGNITNAGILCEKGVTSSVGILALPHLRARARAFDGLVRGNAVCQSFYMKTAFPFQPRGSEGITSKRVIYTIPRSSNSSNSSDSKDDSSDQAKFAGVDPLQAGNVVQLVLVLGLTIGWISTYIFRVSNKEMTYAQQLRDYENKVMEKRLEGLSEAELEALLEQVEEEKRRLTSGEQVN
ncbi:uncharacterized protein LOC107418510 isoform X7 [Ziziphus jujuba]|uniref:Uncharacterized protein LOC107418510 isoform X7 n=1 Tax=Ziziphus jujuba TaxID=326968 RepID=A0ABM4A1Z1_ZIZJJ|nr:uncharacterized protein LOC107418510 isoform X7 [Ziziphus jujuba]